MYKILKNRYLKFVRVTDIHVLSQRKSRRMNDKCDHRSSCFWTDDDMLFRYQLPARRDTHVPTLLRLGEVNDPRRSRSYRSF